MRKLYEVIQHYDCGGSEAAGFELENTFGVVAVTLSGMVGMGQGILERLHKRGKIQVGSLRKEYRFI